MSHLYGRAIDGKVKDVFRWGVVVDIGQRHVGFIDPLYIEDGDRYEVGDTVSIIVDGFDSRKQQYYVRPPGQISIADRLRAKGHDSEPVESEWPPE